MLAAIKGAGIADKDVQTSRLSLQPQYDPNKAGAAHLTGFQVTNQVTVKIHDIDNLPGVLDRAIAAGANEMSGIEFVVSEQSKLLDEARSEAIADAHRKAEIYAAAAGAKVGHVVAISEGSSPAAADRHAGVARRHGSGGARRADAAGAGHRELRVDAVAAQCLESEHASKSLATCAAGEGLAVRRYCWRSRFARRATLPSRMKWSPSRARVISSAN